MKRDVNTVNTSAIVASAIPSSYFKNETLAGFWLCFSLNSLKMHVQNIIIVLFNNLVLQSLQQSLNWYLWWINDSLQHVTWLKKERDNIEFYISYNS